MHFSIMYDPVRAGFPYRPKYLRNQVQKGYVFSRQGVRTHTMHLASLR